MALYLNISLGGIARANGISGSLHISSDASITDVLDALRGRSESRVAEGRLFGWGGLQTWLNTHRQVGCCIIIDADFMKLSDAARVCIRTTQDQVTWIATMSLADLVKYRADEWVNQWNWCFPTKANLAAVDNADRALNRQSANLHVTDCQVIRQVQGKQLKAWLDRVWEEIGELQPVLARLAQASDFSVSISAKERILDELGLYSIGKGNCVSLTLLLLSYVRVNHCQGGWLHEARCGSIGSWWGWLRRLANDGYRLVRKAWLWITSILMLIVGVFVFVSEFARLDSGTPLQLEQLIKLLSGVMLIVAVMVIKKLRHTLNPKYAARVFSISILVIVLPLLHELFTFLLDRPIEIPTLIWFLLSFALVAFLLIGVFTEEI